MALKQELATPTYSYDAQGRKALESKDRIRSRPHGAGSLDIADAFAMQVAPRDEYQHVKHKPYHPFEDIDTAEAAAFLW